ncbi:MAG: ubiquitin-like protein Pup [Actinomycetota bacterium]|nr:ubiquitin-like protein Pup [Actinomycetota bacterium]
MRQQRIRVQKQHRARRSYESEVQVTDPARAHDGLKQDMKVLLDEIDKVLSEHAAQFV